MVSSSSAEARVFHFSRYIPSADEACSGLELCPAFEEMFRIALQALLEKQQQPVHGKHLGGVLSPVLQLLLENHGILTLKTVITHVPNYKDNTFR